MSQENVELVTQAFAALSEGGVQAMASYWDPEIEVTVPPELAQAGTYRGTDAVTGWISGWSEAWEQIEYTPEKMVERDDTVVVTVRYAGVGRGSGMRIEDRFWYLLRLRGGKVIYLRLYSNEAEALAAAGLSE